MDGKNGEAPDAEGRQVRTRSGEDDGDGGGVEPGEEEGGPSDGDGRRGSEGDDGAGRSDRLRLVRGLDMTKNSGNLKSSPEFSLAKPALYALQSSYLFPWRIAKIANGLVY